LKGKLIYSEIENTNHINLSVSSLQAGVYLLKVKTEDGTAVKWIMKQ
jgi:LEA14-like dessication related protein